MTELKELEISKQESLFCQIWITLGRPIFGPFATHTLGTAVLEAAYIKTQRPGLRRQKKFVYTLKLFR